MADPHAHLEALAIHRAGTLIAQRAMAELVRETELLGKSTIKLFGEGNLEAIKGKILLVACGYIEAKVVALRTSETYRKGSGDHTQAMTELDALIADMIDSERAAIDAALEQAGPPATPKKDI